MSRKKHSLPVFENVVFTDAGSEGNSVARVGELVVFVPFIAPGDVADIRVTRKKRNWCEGTVIRVHSYGERRQEPFCQHFGTCGGCKWQHLRYNDQLFFKQKQVHDNLTRIGKLDAPLLHPILPSEKEKYYRNKLEYTFCDRRWRSHDEPFSDSGPGNTNALGFHIPKIYDKVLDIRTCYLQPDPSNDIRDFLREYALERGLSFYNVRHWTGFLRNVIIRNNSTGDFMVIMVFREDDSAVIHPFMRAIRDRFSEVTSLFYVINPKKNDVISDLPLNHFSGDYWLIETIPSFREGGRELTFRIGPVSFFQTNTAQSRVLYRKTAELAGFTGDEVVYDLYTGTGTIANYIAPWVRKVIGIESVESAIGDAKMNSELNGISNISFYCGQAENVLTPGFIDEHGKPDIIITDPPRSGMHEKVIRAILDCNPEKIVYVSCNPATQARDLLLLSEKYLFQEGQPVDMFPHTQHVENIAMLKRR